MLMYNSEDGTIIGLTDTVGKTEDYISYSHNDPGNIGSEIKTLPRKMNPKDKANLKYFNNLLFKSLMKP